MSATTLHLSLSIRSSSVQSIFRSKIQNPAKAHHQLSPVSPSSVAPPRQSLAMAFHKQALASSVLHRRESQVWRISATPEDEISQEIVSSSTSVGGGGGGEEGISVIIQVLLFAAFVALAVLTIGVVYIGVSDFMEKRERDKFQKEEASKKAKKSGKKNVARARARPGPRGFGQKVDEEDDDFS